LVAAGAGSIILNATGSGGADDLLMEGAHIGGLNAAANIVINANTLLWDELTDFQSTGALVIRPRTPRTTIGLGDSPAGTLHLDNSLLSRILDAFASITIGDALFGTGAVNVTNAAFTDPVAIAGGTIRVDGLNAGTNTATLVARTGAITSAAGLGASPV